MSGASVGAVISTIHLLYVEAVIWTHTFVVCFVLMSSHSRFGALAPHLFFSSHLH